MLSRNVLFLKLGDKYSDTLFIVVETIHIHYRVCYMYDIFTVKISLVYVHIKILHHSEQGILKEGRALVCS